MVTLIKYGTLSGGEKYNVNVLNLDGLSTDTKPTRTFIEYGSDGREVGRTGIPNGSLYTEIDTGDTYMYDTDNTTWHKVSIGGGSGGGFTPTAAQLDAMNSGINSTKVAQITTNENNILLKANTSDVNTATANLQAQINQIAQAAGTGTAETEIAQARISTDGSEHDTLKDRIDYDDEKTNSRISRISTKSRNLAEVKTDFIYSGVTVTYNSDGSIAVNGTPSNTSFVCFNDLPAGTYTATWNDEVTSLSGCSLRYGENYSSYSTRWLNSTNKQVTITVSEEVKVMLALNKNTVYDNAVFKIEIEKGENVGKFVKPGTTAYDVVARSQFEDTAEKVEELSVAIENIDDIMNRDKSTWSPMLNDVKNKMIALNTQSRKLNFAVITDTHVFPEADNFVCLDNIQLFAEATQYCDFSVHCGDVVESGDMTNTGLTSSTTVSKADRLKNWMAFLEQVKTVKCPLYICRGNHDVQYKIGVGDPITNSEFDSLVRQQAKDVVRDDEQPFKTYYYKDFTEFKVRAIILNQYNEIVGTTGNSPQKNYGTQQMKWLAEVALNFTNKTNPSSWHTVIFAHGTTFDVDGLRGILYAYCRGNSYSSETASMDFSEQGAGNLIAIIHGDSHQDEYNTETESSIKYNCIGIDQSFVKSWAGTSTGETDDTAGLSGSKKYCVDLFTVDTANKTLYETRIGRGKSRVYTYGDIDTPGANSRTIINDEG